MRKALAVSLLVVVLGLFFAPALHAQGCVMCYTSAAGQDPAAARKLDMAILALLVPVLLLFVGVMGMLIHRRGGEEETLALLPAENSTPHLQPVTRIQLEISPSSGD